MYERLYLDLDRTLFDTVRFSDALIAAFEDIYKVPARDFRAQMPQFYVHHADMQYYDFYGHVASLGHNPAAVAERLRPELAGGDYLFADAHSLLAALSAVPPVQTTILSYGPSNYQQYKVSFVPELQRLPFVATLQFKQDYLASKPPAPSLLVDDKLVAPLPTWCSQFLIDRSATAAKIAESAHVWRINSLETVETAVSLAYNERNQKEIR